MNAPLIHAPTALDIAKDMLQSCIDESLAAGMTFNEDELIELGWLLFKVAKDKDQALSLHAPLFWESPVTWQQDCSNALNLILTQKYICDSFEVEMEECRFDMACLCIKDYQLSDDQFFNRIGTAENSDSGWYLGRESSELDPDEEENLCWVSLWDLCATYPWIAEFLLLPVNYQVSLKGRPIVLHDYEEAPCLSDSYYAQQHGPKN